ncbi:efflux RND transporter periplasmic adaptor subunit [candidate division KSB1 bacterium]|nr:efflux RND transporter periplasmic adaptor subunit [candidate division KSB1 bacterium]MBL7095927.1 efflux RND transporter periplasmic adaptor subunit [candidate division KSB1 bacterium]
MTRKILISITAGFILLISLVAMLKSNSKTNETRNNKITVKTAPVLTKEISLPIHTSGKLASKTEMKLSFKIGGITEDILVEEGQKVRKGQLLAKLDQSEINAKVTQVRSGFAKVSRDLERVKKLYADSVATLEQKQDATTAYEVALSNIKVAEFNLQHSAIYAPQDGKILKRLGEKNELIGAGMPVFFFGSTGKDWIVRAGVSDRDIIRLQLGDSASVLFDAYPDKKFPAYVSEIAEAADPRTGTYEIELVVISTQQKLVSGFVAQTKIFPSDHKRYAIIPIEALVEGDGRNGFVFTLSQNSNEVKKILVRIAFLINDKVAVEYGLENVDNVVTEGSAYLGEGSVVEVLKIR